VCRRLYAIILSNSANIPYLLTYLTLTPTINLCSIQCRHIYTWDILSLLEIMVCLPLRLSVNVFQRGIPVKCRYLNDTQLFLKFACMFGSKNTLRVQTDVSFSLGWRHQLIGRLRRRCLESMNRWLRLKLNSGRWRPHSSLQPSTDCCATEQACCWLKCCVWRFRSIWDHRRWYSGWHNNMMALWHHKIDAA